MRALYPITMFDLTSPCHSTGHYTNVRQVQLRVVITLKKLD